MQEVNQSQYVLKTWLLAAVLLISLSGCQHTQPKEYFQLRGFAQGTTYNIIYHHPERLNLSHNVDSILEQVDSSMSLYNPTSTIAAFNSSKAGVAIDSLLEQAVKLSLYYNKITNGTFDITVGPLVKRWGFHGIDKDIPDSSEIERILSFTGRDMISLNKGFLSKAYPEVTIDVNAIAQGYAVDLISEYFNQQGVTDYLVEVGGEVRTMGSSSRGDRWIIGVDRPEDNILSGENLQVKIGLSGESLVTSGNYRKFYERDGTRYSHTIDPSTGYPVTHTLLSATVLDKTSAGADALATTFMVLGLEGTQQWIQEHGNGIEAYLVYSSQEGGFKVWMTEGLQERIVK